MAYVVGIYVKGSKNEHNEVSRVGNEHITLSFLGECSEEKLNHVKSYLNSFPREFTVKITDKDMFGPNNDMPVYLVSPLDKSIKKHILSLFQRYNIEQEHTKGLSFPNLHITKKCERNIGDELLMSGLFIKKVGGETILL